MSVFAWAHGVTVPEAVALAARFPGLGLVLYPTNYGAATDLAVPPIMYATTVEHARVILALAESGVYIRAVLVDDERNADGPSGAYLTPTEYAKRFALIYDTLRGVVPVFTMGLQPLGNFWQEILRRRTFDDAYHAQLPPADGRAFNPNKVRLAEVHRVLRKPGPWVLSPAPFRGWWDRANQPINVARWGSLSKHTNVTAVALWCLREAHDERFGWQPQHGLLDRHGNITNVGREVLAALR